MTTLKRPAAISAFAAALLLGGVVHAGDLAPEFDDQPEMVTMYHLDGEELLATHYCSANNQPRMRAVSFQGEKDLRFDFRDITNLAKPEASHMRALRVVFDDKDHFEQFWTWRQDGKEDTLPLKFERKGAPPAPQPPYTPRKQK